MKNLNETPLISIITVVYNGEKYLKQTIESVLNQSYKNIEYIIVDGGSTDNTLSIIKEYGNRIDTLISEPDKGLYDAMNKGIGLAKGELIGMINSDDWYSQNAVELVVDSYASNPTKKIFHGDRYDVLENGDRRIKKFHTSNLKFIYYCMTYNHPSMFVHKDCYENIRYNINFKSLSDYEFVLKTFLKSKEIFYYIPVAYVSYRLDGISSNINGYDALKEGYQARKNAGLSFIKNIISVNIRVLNILFFKIKNLG
ncbi:glycosyltransferase family 2 protein [Maribacter aquivivus]|uniref:glycosyltransferase family 2 protein n=1 Tax=Maribacter aquivivus TaxID=228958 RepID=UPI0024935B05|nr:glycosyltransferase family 2 protein [Maribacter aquivivus]